MDAAQKTLSVLDALAVDAAGGTRLGDIAARAGLPRSTVHRILQRLVEHGYARAEGDGRYVAGPRVLALAGGVLRQLDHGYLTPVLSALREDVGHTVHFALLTGHEATYIEKLEVPGAGYQMASRVGGRMPLHCTSIGKAILAGLPVAERHALLGRSELVARTSRTLVTLPELDRELERVREDGYAVDDEENERNIRCVGAAVHDTRGRPTGAVSVSALTLDLTPDEVPAVGRRVRAAADELSEALSASRSHGAPR
jgi:IclR family transcriptional regulator, acetate operon repressor